MQMMCLMSIYKMKTSFVCCMLIICMIFATGGSCAASEPYKVVFMSQGSGNNNCGPVCLAMAAQYVLGGIPDKKDVERINKDLNLTDKQYKSVQQIAEAASKVYGLNQVNFGHWTLEEIVSNLTSVGPVIVGVNSKYLPARNYSYAGDHFVLVLGTTKDSIICHDPGSRLDANISYPINNFRQSIGNKATPVVYGFSSLNPKNGDYISPNIGTLKYVPAGSFQRDETAANISTVSAFRMSQYEITRAQFRSIMKTDPSDTKYSTGTKDPVQNVNWYHAIAFCNKLSIAEGLTPVYSVSGINFTTLTYADIPTTDNTTWDAATANWSANGYRLPTEMEWMWAAMGATSGYGYSGGTYTTGYTKTFAGSTGSNFIGDYAVFGYHCSEVGGTTTARSNPVGTKLPNELGLYDMSGNVSEWCWGWTEVYPSGTLTNYRGTDSSSGARVQRGGEWSNNASTTSVDDIGYSDANPSHPYYVNGFRVVRKIGK